MATKGAKATARKAKAPAKRARHAPQSRGTRSTGRRTTLRVPKTLDAEVNRVSRELKISRNEALVHLAALGAERARRERAVRKVVERRRAAVMGASAGDVTAPFPSEGELREAILVDRD